MGKASENQWHIHGAEQRPPARRDQVFKDITLALVAEHSVSSELRRRGGFDPYDNRLGTTRRDVWDRQRRDR
jgi:hypothetical protein